jgi:hypothetical protein
MARPLAFLVTAVIACVAGTSASAGGPFGSIKIGSWSGGAYTNDANAFTHCAAGGMYNSEVYVVLSKDNTGFWSIGFAKDTFRFAEGEKIALVISFDGQPEQNFNGFALSSDLAATALSDASLLAFRRSHSMTLSIMGLIYNFNLPSTDRLAATVENCVNKTRAVGIKNVGDFSLSISNPSSSSSNSKPQNAATTAQTSQQNGTGILISANGHIVTNYHVINNCVGDIQGNLSGEGAATLRVVATDETNDLALLQAPLNGKGVATIRASAAHPGDTVIAIGYPFHGLLTSDFTVTAGIVSSLSGLLNDTRYMQISAAVQRVTAAAHF